MDDKPESVAARWLHLQLQIERREVQAKQQRSRRLTVSFVSALILFVVMLVVPPQLQTILLIVLLAWVAWLYVQVRPGRCEVCGRKTIIEHPDTMPRPDYDRPIGKLWWCAVKDQWIPPSRGRYLCMDHFNQWIALYFVG